MKKKIKCKQCKGTRMVTARNIGKYHCQTTLVECGICCGTGYELPKYKNCPTCNGTGEVFDHSIRGSGYEGDFIGVGTYKKCSNCKGTGKCKKIKK